MNFGSVPSGEFRVPGDPEPGDRPSTGDDSREEVGEGFGVRNMPRGRGTLRSTATGRGALSCSRMKQQPVGWSPRVVFSSNKYIEGSVRYL